MKMSWHIVVSPIYCVLGKYSKSSAMGNVGDLYHRTDMGCRQIVPSSIYAA